MDTSEGQEPTDTTAPALEAPSEAPSEAPAGGRSCSSQGRPFDPVGAAQDARRGEDPTATVVTQMAGYVSACWDNLAGAGVFQSDRAKQAVEATLAWLAEQRDHTVRLGDDERLVLRMTETVNDLGELVRTLLHAEEHDHRMLVVDSSIEAYVVAADSKIIADAQLGQELLDLVPTSRCSDHVDQAPARPHAHLEDAGTAAAVCR